MSPEDPLDTFDAGNPEHLAQLHINIERVRVPEVSFQPSLAGIDSAGLLEVIEHILKGFSPDERDRLTQVSLALPDPIEISLTKYRQNVYLTGGYSRVPNLDLRLKKELTSVLPVGSPVNLVRAKDAQLDAWRGLAKFTESEAYNKTKITMADWQEKGGEYILEHDLSNSYKLLYTQ